MVKSDDLVLLGLDGRHDVAHPLTAGCADSSQQGGVGRAANLVAVAQFAEDLVGEVKDPAPAGVELAAPADALGVCRGGRVERARRRRPPIEQQRFVFVALVEQPDASDVGALPATLSSRPKHKPSSATSRRFIRRDRARTSTSRSIGVSLSSPRNAVRYLSVARARSSSSRA